MLKSSFYYFSILFLLFFARTTIAQTLTMENITPQIGDHFITHSSLAVPIGESGENVTWDLSGLVALDTNTHSYETPFNHSKATFFPSATIVGISGDAGEFLDISSFAWQRLGFSAQSSDYQVNYSNDPEVFLSFPFHYNKTFVNDFSGTVTSSGVTSPRTGSITVTGDGTGTLIMPYGEFKNVLRVKVLEVTTDSIANGTVTIKTLTHSWFQEGIHAAIASVIETTVGLNVTTRASFLDESIILSNQSLSRWDTPVLTFPNPATDHISVAFQLQHPSRVQWQLVSMKGEQVSPITSEFRATGPNTIQLNLTTIPNGSYILQLIADGKISSKKILVNH